MAGQSIQNTTGFTRPVRTNQDRCRWWFFTANNYHEQDAQKVRANTWDANKFAYTCIGFEVGEQGTPHLQGVVKFTKAIRLTTAQAWLDFQTHCHLEPTVAPKQAIKYCQKEGDFIEYGKQVTQGQRTDVEEVRDIYKEAIEDGNEPNLMDLMGTHCNALLKYKEAFQNYGQQLISFKTLNEWEPRHPLRPWQQLLWEKLQQPPDKPPQDRYIYTVWDPTGNCGKSWFCRYIRKYFLNTTKKVAFVPPGKHGDMVLAMRNQCLKPDIVLTDSPRAKNEYTSYAFQEECKNGSIMSGKYNSGIIDIPQPHVVLFVNNIIRTPTNDLSEDRWYVLKINANGCDVDEEIVGRPPVELQGSTD